MNRTPAPPTPSDLPTLRLDLAGYIQSWNQAATDFFGFSAEEAMGQHLFFLCPDGEVSPSELEALTSNADLVQLDVSRFTKQGQVIKAHLTLSLQRDTAADPVSILAVYEPVPDAISETDRLRLYVSIIEDSAQGVMVTDHHERIVMVNSAFTRITGYSAREAVGQTPDLLQSGLHDRTFRTQVSNAVQGAGLWLGEMLCRRKSGEIFPLSVCISATHGDAQQTTHAFSIFSDLGSHKEAEARLQRLANFDTVTNLPNRLLLAQLLTQALHMAKRNEEQGAVLVVQLQRLGWVYDSMGHEAGDEFIAQAAKRLQHSLREQDILARLGHDKLAVALPNIRQREHAGLVAHKLLALLKPPYVLNGHEVYSPACIGIALYPDDHTEAAGLLRCAEQAIPRDDHLGEYALGYFNAEMTQRASERFRIESELRHGLASGELLLYHQPKVSLRTGRIVGAEALLRWQHPRHGLIGPSSFVPVAEETSLILDLGEWVLHEACRQLRDWQRSGLHMPPLAVNLSARQFDKHLPNRIDAMLAMYGLRAQQLKLEITESLMVRGADEVVPIMNELAAMGLGIALDDFGTGYSSLAYLKKFPISTLKIDRSFVTSITTEENDGAIARAIVTMGQQLRQEIVAEGVETREQMKFLRDLGCDQLQGYLFSRPVPATEYEHMVREDVRLALE
jgi:diguanylate cyclase (GGDEF)-like protein/PAS domain S-box-containing protein